MCVASCKGGVGKSSVALNLATALAMRGQRVGLLDVDIYGPSLPSLLPPLLKDGEQVMATAEGRIIPLIWGEETLLGGGLQVMSYGYIRPNEFAAVRGPIVSGIAGQLLANVAWSELDTLVIDMPPGTGDVHLSVSQQIPVDGSIMVTTPQKLALVDVEKGIKMFDKVGIPTIALVENMSYFQCGDCSARHSVFGVGGGKRLADQFGIESFHQLPLDPLLNSASGDIGEEGPLLARPGVSDRHAVAAIHELAAGVDRAMDQLVASRGMRPRAAAIDGGAALQFTDGGQSPLRVPARSLRLACRCAKCRDEWTHQSLLDPAKVPEDIIATKVESAGRYAVSVSWSDLHSSIHSFADMRELAVEAV